MAGTFPHRSQGWLASSGPIGLVGNPFIGPWVPFMDPQKKTSPRLQITKQEILTPPLLGWTGLKQVYKVWAGLDRPPPPPGIKRWGECTPDPPTPLSFAPSTGPARSRCWTPSPWAASRSPGRSATSCPRPPDADPYCQILLFFPLLLFVNYTLRSGGPVSSVPPLGQGVHDSCTPVRAHPCSPPHPQPPPRQTLSPSHSLGRSPPLGQMKLILGKISFKPPPPTPHSPLSTRSWFPPLSSPGLLYNKIASPLFCTRRFRRSSIPKGLGSVILTLSILSLNPLLNIANLLSKKNSCVYSKERCFVCWTVSIQGRLY